MQLESNNNACKTPNLAVCILLTLTKRKCIWDTQNTQVNRIQRSEQGNHQEQLEDQWGHMHECIKNRNEKYFWFFYDFVIFLDFSKIKWKRK